MPDHKIQRRSIPSLARKAGRIVLTVISVFLACILILVGVLQFWSYPGKPAPFVDENGRPLAGSLSEKVFVKINGVEQGMFIQSKDVTNPVLLYLHGGIPDYFLTERYPTGLEKYFTVVWWEQRGSRLSYSADIQPGTITLEQMIADTLEVTNYLRQRFGKEKIYLMGHSGGSFIGIQAAAQAPELYYAYLALRDVAMHSLGIGTTHDMDSIINGILIPSFQSRDYTLKEKIDLWHGKASSGVASLWREMISTDLSQETPKLDLPVYFMEGIYDYTCSYTEAKAYFDILQAPVKGFYTFEQSAHSPFFEEPEKMQKILLEDVLAGANHLADR